MSTKLPIISLPNLHIIEHEPLSKHTSYAIGGEARWFVRISDVSILPDLFREIGRLGIPWYVLGGGTNTLPGDSGFDGIVIAIADRTILIEGNRVIAAAGVSFAVLVHTAVVSGLTGMEWAFGIPGTVGGAVRGNAGAFGGQTADVLEYADVCNPNTGAVTRMTPDDFAYRYRWSILAKERGVIMRAAFLLTQATPAECKKRLDELLAKKKDTQPLGARCAGCVFKNILTTGLPQSLIPPEYEGKDRIHAAWLLDRAGVKGTRCGGAHFSEKHANFIITESGATSADVTDLIKRAKKLVKEKYGLDLEEEIRYLGNDKITY